MWEHRITLTDPRPQQIKCTLKALGSQGWQVCAAVTLSTGLVELIHKREQPAPRSPKENDQAFQDLIEHHRQHHLRDEPEMDADPKIVSVSATDLDHLKKIRFKAETELQHANEGSTDWYTLRYILDKCRSDEEIDTAQAL